MATQTSRPVRIALIVCILATLSLVALLLANQSLAAAVAKITASTAFIAVAWLSGALRSRYGQVLFAGLVLSFFGDAFLIGETRLAFLAGLSAFLLAHICYVAAFVVHGVSWRWFTVAAVPVVAIAMTVFNWLQPHTPADLLVPVIAYTIVISLMMTAAIGTRGLGASLLIVGGALMFFVSDLSVAAMRIVGTETPTYAWGLPLYYGGQLLLALSVSQSRSH